MEKQQPGSPSYRLKKEMILRGRRLFDRLFAEGNGFRTGPFVVKYLLVDEADRGDEDLSRSNAPIIAAFIVPKRYGRAVDRNRMKRLMREVWRLSYPEHRQLMPEGYRLYIALIWSGGKASEQTPRFERIDRDIRQGMKRLAGRLNGSRGKGDVDPEPTG